VTKRGREGGGEGGEKLEGVVKRFGERRKETMG